MAVLVTEGYLRLQPISPFAMEENMCHQRQGALLHHKLWDVFCSTLERRLSLVLGNCCCPYPADPASLTQPLPLWQPVTQLDGSDGRLPTSRSKESEEPPLHQPKDDHITDEAL